LTKIPKISLLINKNFGVITHIKHPEKKQQELELLNKVKDIKAYGAIKEFPLSLDSSPPVMGSKHVDVLLVRCSAKWIYACW